MSDHKLICHYEGPPKGSRHTCEGCDWEVYTYTRPGNPATHQAVQHAYDLHLQPGIGLDAGAD
jgi:hypothetical protein